MCRHNVFYIYMHRSKNCEVPFYIGFGKQEAINKPIKQGRNLNKSELLRRVLHDMDLLESRIIQESLLKADADVDANHLISACIDLGGCIYQDSTALYPTLESKRAVLNKYLPHLLTYQVPEINYYQTLESNVDKEYERILRARQRIRMSRGQDFDTPTPENSYDPFGPQYDPE